MYIRNLTQFPLTVFVYDVGDVVYLSHSHSFQVAAGATQYYRFREGVPYAHWHGKMRVTVEAWPPYEAIRPGPIIWENMEVSVEPKRVKFEMGGGWQTIV